MDYTGVVQTTSSAQGVRFQVFNTCERMSQHAADIICAELRRRPALVLCVSAGGTPARTYEILAARRSRQPALFRKMRVVQIDEWCGLPFGSPATCAADLRKKFLDPLQISSNRFAGFRTDSSDHNLECARMARWLDRNGPIDICILGLGKNGHVAMNEPAPELQAGVHVATLAPSSLKHALLQDLKTKPRYGFTLGMGDILRSQKVLLLVSGRPKRKVLKKLRAPSVSTYFPASLLWLHSDATILCDQKAAKTP